ncbi:hypothetical protein [Streptosporangium jomthongense]|uniref:ABC transporter permease n=1 Tax=Streptosporangium jomthongense TaxID=1193683 RepID=A0ABV8F9D2_9ACTN
MRTWLRIGGGAVLFVHGVIHIAGFLLLWRITEVGELTYGRMVPDPGTAGGRLVGVVWLGAAALFCCAAVLLAVGRPAWAPTVLAATALSLPILLADLSQTGAGVVVDVVVLTGTLLAFLLVRRDGETA